jgi:SAM-dependent methyltransferase
VSAATKSDVRLHWDADPCGARLAEAPRGSPAFFAQVEAARYALEPFIPEFADFERWSGRDVLEVGTGLGTDFVRFGRAGARLTGIDLTTAAVDLVGRRLELEGLSADVRVGDAEALPFANASFDLVYSWGVLHHTPDTRQALAEVRRVLRSDGEARIMLYSRRSWVAAGVWLRYGLARGRPWNSISELLAAHMESPGTKAYTQRELEELFREFTDVRLTRFTTPYDRRVGGPLVKLLGPRLGWFVGIVALP